MSSNVKSTNLDVNLGVPLWARKTQTIHTTEDIDGVFLDNLPLADLMLVEFLVNDPSASSTTLELLLNDDIQNNYTYGGFAVNQTKIQLTVGFNFANNQCLSGFLRIFSRQKPNIDIQTLMGIVIRSPNVISSTTLDSRVEGAWDSQGNRITKILIQAASTQLFREVEMIVRGYNFT